jgi:hypothetical protein
MTVKFKDAHSAQACVLKMNGRFFDGRRVSPSLHSPNRPNARGRRYTPASIRARNGINVREPASHLERARTETRKNRNGLIISLSGSSRRKGKRARTSTRMFMHWIRIRIRQLRLARISSTRLTLPSLPPDEMLLSVRVPMRMSV